jgi:hypothetical protein
MLSACKYFFGKRREGRRERGSHNNDHAVRKCNFKKFGNVVKLKYLFKGTLY